MTDLRRPDAARGARRRGRLSHAAARPPRRRGARWRRPPWPLAGAVLLAACSAAGGGDDGAWASVTPQAAQRAAASLALDDSSPVHLAVVAHEDDDLLFMSPALVDHIAAGHAVGTVLLTAGDDGQASAYWQAREAGLRAAYAEAAGVADAWEAVAVPPGPVRVNQVRLRARPQVSLTFLRLPDGGLGGNGFAAHHHESLRQLWDDTVTTVQPVDGGPPVSREALIDSLRRLIDAFYAAAGDGELHVLNCGVAARPVDHPDHHASALFALEAQHRAAAVRSVTLHWGYEVSQAPANLGAAQVARKWRSFSTYAAFDPGISGPGPRRTAPQHYRAMSQRAYVWRARSDALSLANGFCHAVGAPLTPDSNGDAGAPPGVPGGQGMGRGAVPSDDSGSGSGGNGDGDR